MANDTKDSKDNKNKKPDLKKPKFSPYWIYGSIFVIFLALQLSGGSNFSQTKKTSQAEFENYLRQGDVQKVEIVNKKVAKVYLTQEARSQGVHTKNKPKGLLTPGANDPTYEFEFGDLQNFENNFQIIKRENNLDTQIIWNTETNLWGEVIVGLLPFIVIIGIWIFIMRRMSGGGAGGGAGGQIFNIGKSKAKLFDEKLDVKTSFKDVAGLEGAKEEVQEIVDFLKFPEKYTALGGKIPKGALLVGPPGTGKTLLARAVAGEAKVPFFSLSGSDFVEMFVGVGASRVRDMFKTAKQNAPCIVFIDEIDAVGRQRGTGMGGGHDEREQTLNQLLVEMDGFGTNSGIIVIAATNRPDVLDPAILRPGRFDRQITIGRPDIKSRKAILEVHAKNKKVFAYNIEGNLYDNFPIEGATPCIIVDLDNDNRYELIVGDALGSLYFYKNF